jgi:hypothetical protein
MKAATQLALYGAIAIVFTRIFYLLASLQVFGAIDFYLSKMYLVTNTIDLIASIAIVNFFYVLYQKQNSKSKQNE